MSQEKIDFSFNLTWAFLFPVQLLETLLAFIQTSRFLNNPEVKAFAKALVMNQFGPLRASTAQCVSVDLSIHLAAVLLCGCQGVLVPLQHLAFKPANMQVRAVHGQLLRGNGLLILRNELILIVC